MFTETIEISNILDEIKQIVEQAAALQTSEPQRAVEKVNEAFDMLKTLNGYAGSREARILQVRSLTILAVSMARLGEFQNALPKIQEALQIARDLGDTDSITNTLIYNGYINRFLSEFDLSKKFYEEAVESAKSNKNFELQARAITGLGMLCHSWGDYSCALTKFSEALQIQERIGDELGTAYTLQNIGGIYSAFYDFASAQEYFSMALEKWRQLGNKHGEGMTLNNIGIILRDMLNFDKAKELFEHAIKIHKETGDLNSLALAIMNLATVYGHKDQHEEAKKNYTEVLKIHQSSGNRFAEGSTLLNLGNSHMKLGDYSKAYEYFVSAIEIIFALDAKRNFPPLLHRMAELAMVQPKLFTKFDWKKYSLETEEKLHPAEIFLRSAYKIASGMQAKSDICNTAGLFASFYKECSNFELALQYHEEHFRIEREIFNEESDQRTKIIMVRFETERALKQAEILRLENEKLEQDMYHRKQELDSMTLYLVQKNQALSSVRKLASDAVRAKADARKKILQQILKLTSSGGESFWHHFDERFKMVHGDFSERLMKKFPDLTPMEVRICVLVKAGLSSKELAEILSISERTAENHRTNVRKKLNLSRTANLTSYLGAF